MNSKKGGVSLNTDAGEIFVRISTNAMCKFQDMTGQSFPDAIQSLQDSPNQVSLIRSLFWAGVSHLDGMTLEGAGDLMDDAGLPTAMEALSKAAELAFGPVEDEPTGNAPAGKPAKKQTT